MSNIENCQAAVSILKNDLHQHLIKYPKCIVYSKINYIRFFPLTFSLFIDYRSFQIVYKKEHENNRLNFTVSSIKHL